MRKESNQVNCGIRVPLCIEEMQYHNTVQRFKGGNPPNGLASSWPAIRWKYKFYAFKSLYETVTGHLT
jgi:hypothetical protein